MTMSAPYRSGRRDEAEAPRDLALGPTRREVLVLLVGVASIVIVIVGVPMAVVTFGERALWLAPVAFVLGVTSLGVGSWLSNKSYYAAVDARALRASADLEPPRPETDVRSE